jgi:hypothetical protein
MAVTVKAVERLNEKIEKLNQHRTKVQTTQELLESQLATAIEEYKKNYGIDLKGKDFKATKKLIESECLRVSKEIEDEYSLKDQVVEAIESGDITKAETLLGVSHEEEEPEEVVEKEEPNDDWDAESGEYETAEGESESEEDFGATEIGSDLYNEDEDDTDIFDADPELKSENEEAEGQEQVVEEDEDDSIFEDDDEEDDIFEDSLEDDDDPYDMKQFLNGTKFM